MNTKTYLAAIFSLFFIFSVSLQVVSASARDKIKGYAWSDGAGWISFNCYNTNSCSTVEYGVNVDSSGKVSGFAWSDTLGWIDFSYYNNAKLDTTTGIWSGDAHFLTADAINENTAPPNGDGWEGKLSLSGTSPSYGPVLDTNSFEVDGYAWGDSVVGWVDFKTAHSVVTYDPFYFSFTSNKGTIDNKVLYNGSVILSWETLGANSCESLQGTPAWTSANPQPAGEPSTASQTISNLTSDTTFTLRCQDSAGHKITRTLNILVNPPYPSVVIGVDDSNIGYGTSTNINWTATGVSSCTASGDWTGSKPVGTNSESTGNLTATPNTYEISCMSSYPATYPDPVTDITYVDVEKLVIDFYAEQSPIPYNDKIKLFYTTEFPVANSCVATGTVPGWAGFNIDESPGEHFFETADKISAEGVVYTATIKCSGSGGQADISKSVLIKVGKNPLYQEV